jgi:hypothetical protein
VNAYTTPFVGTNDGSVTPFNRLSNPFPSGIIQAPGRNPNFQQLFLGQGFSAPLPHDPAGYAQQWNFDVQRELPSGIAVDVAYAGSKGSHLPGPNQQIDQLPDEFLKLGAALQQQVPKPVFGLVQVGTLANPTVARGQLLRPFPQYNGQAITSPMSRSSIYHSGQVKVEKRFKSGGSILGAYTWAKLISDTDTLTAWLEPNGGLGVRISTTLRSRSRRQLRCRPPSRGQLQPDLPSAKASPCFARPVSAARSSPDGAMAPGFPDRNAAQSFNRGEQHQSVGRFRPNSGNQRAGAARRNRAPIAGLTRRRLPSRLHSRSAMWHARCRTPALQVSRTQFRGGQEHTDHGEVGLQFRTEIQSQLRAIQLPDLRVILNSGGSAANNDPRSYNSPYACSSLRRGSCSRRRGRSIPPAAPPHDHVPRRPKYLIETKGGGRHCSTTTTTAFSTSSRLAAGS